MSKKLGVLVMGVAYMFVACGLLVGCGTKGPLYIPEQRYPQAASKKPNEPKIEPKIEPKTNQSGSDTQHTGQ